MALPIWLRLNHGKSFLHNRNEFVDMAAEIRDKEMHPDPNDPSDISELKKDGRYIA